jgi:hypothetical protein
LWSIPLCKKPVPKLLHFLQQPSGLWRQWCRRAFECIFVLSKEDVSVQVKIPIDVIVLNTHCSEIKDSYTVSTCPHMPCLFLHDDLKGWWLGR